MNDQKAIFNEILSLQLDPKYLKYIYKSEYSA